MYEMAKKAREAMKSKARRLAGEKDVKTDSSNWTPASPLNASVKTGARPIMKPSKKGLGESYAARDTKSAIGDAIRGAYKSGGGVKDKKALGDIDPTPKRGAVQHYKKGGRIKREDGGKLPNPYEAMRSEERMGRMKVEEKRKLPPPKEAAESAARTGDSRKYGGKKLAKKRGGGVGLTVVIADKGGRGAPQGMTAPITPRAVPVPMGAQGSMAPPPMMHPGAVGGAPPAMRKSGGRVTKVASSYKDMQAGAAAGEARLQKTDIAKKRKGAPTS